MRTFTFLDWFKASLLFASAGAGVAATGCGSGGSGTALPYCAPAASCPASVDGIDLEAPVVSFQADVFPIFQQTCNDSACHGPSNPNNAAGEIYLGSATATPTSAQLANIISDLVNNPSAIGPDGTRDVVPGNWQTSFLMLKVDGCQNEVGLDCAGTAEANEDSVCDPPEPCGDGMPQLDADDADALGVEPFPLSEDQRHTIRRWIHQGAQNN